MKRIIKPEVPATINLPAPMVDWSNITRKPDISSGGGGNNAASVGFDGGGAVIGANLPLIDGGSANG